jgi:hypothetical protein
LSGTELNRAPSHAVGSPGKWVYTVGQLAVWIELLIFRRWLGGEFLLFRSIGLIPVGPKTAPVKAVDWFAFLQVHPLFGFTFLNGLDMVNFLLAGIVVLVLYAVLKRTDHNFMALAVAFMLAAIAVYIASNPALPMLALSDQYAAAATDAQRAAVVSTGEAVLASKNVFSVGENVAFVFFHVAGLIVSLVMLRSGIFSRRCAYLGMLFNGFGLGFPLAVVLAPGNIFLPGAAWVIGVIFWVFWYTGIALTLRRLGRALPEAVGGDP